MRRQRMAWVLLLALVTAGCLGGLQDGSLDASSDDGPDTPDVKLGVPSDVVELLEADHDHQDPAIHDRVANFTQLGTSSLIGTPREPGAYADIDLFNDTAVVSVKQPTGGFVLVDVSDPADPEVLSFYESGPNYSPDAKFGPDGELVFIATHGGVSDTRSRDAVVDLADDQSPVPYGVQLVDVSDRHDPRWLSYMPCGSSGVHNVNTAAIGGSTWVFGACYDSFLNRVVVGEVVDGPNGPELVRRGEFSLGDLVGGNVGSVHDMVVNEDPLEDRPVLTVSYGDEGVVWVDVTDPTAPGMLGQWKGMGPDESFLHYAETYESPVDDRRITVAAPEFWSHDHTGYVWIVDNTDYDDPQLLSKWRISETTSYETGYLYSPHNFQLRDGKVFIVHNHAGLWAIDFASTPDRLTDPVAVGHYVKGLDPGHDLPIDYGPDYWGLDIADDGTILVSDRGSGLHAVSFGS